MNLYDLTHGNYTITRTITYPDHPDSKIVTRAQVKATKETEWDTNISIDGTYTGPTDVTSVRDYQANWTSDGQNILEKGSATLVLKSGGAVRQVWESTITLPTEGVSKFPKEGEQININVSSFQVEGNKLSYSWDGTVRLRSQ